jgi:hypothetical protein
MNVMKKNLALSLARVFRLYCLVCSLIISNSAIADTGTRINIGSSVIDLTFAPGAGDKDFVLGQQKIVHWIEESANAVADYFQGFPVTKLNVAINPGTRSRINGKAYHGEIPLIVLSIRKNISAADLKKDWVLVHEMVHLAFPPMLKRHHWAEEGLATYVEPLVRVRANLLNKDEAWRWLIEGTPKGLPEHGDRGLDFTPTWGRTYWGGAVYFFLADMQIREQSKDRFNLMHALRAIKKAGGNMQLEHTWPITKALGIGDKATGTTVLVSLYNQMKSKPMMIDLKAIWKKLGVRIANSKIVYNNKAPQAALRRALISAKNSPKN